MCNITYYRCNITYYTVVCKGCPRPAAEGMLVHHSLIYRTLQGDYTAIPQALLRPSGDNMVLQQSEAAAAALWCCACCCCYCCPESACGQAAITLHCIVLHCIPLHCTALHCSSIAVFCACCVLAGCCGRDRGGLLRPRTAGWDGWARPWPVCVCVCVCVGPHTHAGLNTHTQV